MRQADDGSNNRDVRMRTQEHRANERSMVRERSFRIYALLTLQRRYFTSHLCRITNV